MKSLFIEEAIPYDGTQLRSHWIYRKTGLQGDAIAAFIGMADVQLDQMVDLEDVAAKKPIFSEQMLHFIVEHFDEDLERMVLRQRLLISLMQEELNESIHPLRAMRKGDDLFLEHFKLTVSIATRSPVSSLIHTGINISSDNTPLPTKGLADFSLNPHAFARSVMNRYMDELAGIQWARSKVRGVE